jgi:hypothetical protein
LRAEAPQCGSFVPYPASVWFFPDVLLGDSQLFLQKLCKNMLWATFLFSSTIPKSLRELVPNLMSQSCKGYIKERCERVGRSLFEYLFAIADTILTLIATCLWRGSRRIVTHEIWNSATQSLLSTNLRTQYYNLNSFLCGI